MRLTCILGLCALLLASPVLAAPSTNAEPSNTCGWSAQMEDDEGGPIMVASSCESDIEWGPVFRLMCGEGINIRYYGLEMDAGLPAPTTLVLTSGGTSLDADVIYEEMDGALAAYVALSSPIISLLKTGEEVGVTFEGMDLPPRMVSLTGSSAAIDKLISDCR